MALKLSDAEAMLERRNRCFMQADMDELVHVKLEGQMAELLVRLEPKLYRKYVQLERGKSVLYVELKKALYGTLRASLLFWKNARRGSTS